MAAWGLALAGAALAQAAAQDRPPEPAGARAAFASCPGARRVLRRAADLTWQPQPSQLAEHRALRSRLHLELPEGRARILFYSTGTHHWSVQFSVVATRGDDGVWHADEAGEEGGGLLRVPTTALPHRAYDLSARESRRLDALLRDRCLYAAPTFLAEPDLVGGAVQTVEIETGRRRAILAWYGMRTPREEELVRLIARD